MLCRFPNSIALWESVTNGPVCNSNLLPKKNFVIMKEKVLQNKTKTAELLKQYTKRKQNISLSESQQLNSSISTMFLKITDMLFLS